MPPLSNSAWPAFVLIVLVLSAVSTISTAQDTGEEICRMDPSSAHAGCGLPQELSNFQGYYACENSTLIGRPGSIEDLQEQVAAYPRVKAVGVGHSWWKEQFCAGADSSALNIVTTELPETLALILNPVYNMNNEPGFPIQVDEQAQTVTAAAGVPQRILLDYLASFQSNVSANGYTLAAFSWFIDQTIGGAVATATHGSTMRFGTLSDQLVGIQVVLANGTLLDMTEGDNPHLWRALRVSVGRLGVITQVTLNIVPQKPVQRTFQDLTFQEFAASIKAVQDQYNTALLEGSIIPEAAALTQIDETQCFWFVPTNDLWRIDYSRLDYEPLAALLNMEAQANQSVTAQEGPAPPGVYYQQYKSPIAPVPALTADARAWSNLFATQIRGYATSGTYEALNAYLSMSSQGVAYESTFAPYDQYEVAVPLDVAGDCLLQVGAQIYGSADLWEGFRTPALIRFVTGSDAYLSPTNGKPHMYVNLEDFVSKSNGMPNQPFLEVIKLFRSVCGARLHWGKAGWPEFAPCFDGSQEYPNSWCDFGCAVQELDPHGKFSSESSVWAWQAALDGATVPFASCCTAQGFSSRCTCAPRQACPASAGLRK